MHRLISKGYHPGRSRLRFLLIVLVALGASRVLIAIGPILAPWLAAGQRTAKGQLRNLASRLSRDPRVPELTGLIGTEHHTGPLAFSPDGKTLALPKRDGRVEIWDLKTRRGRSLVSAFNTDKASAWDVAFSADGRLLAVLYEKRISVWESEQRITVWDLAAMRERSHIPIPQASAVRAMAFADGDRTLVAIAFMTHVKPIVRMERGPERRNYSAVRWDVETGKQREAHAFDPILRFEALSPDGWYAVLSDGAVCTVFDLTTGRRIFDINASCCVFADDGSALVSYTDMSIDKRVGGDQVALWDVPSGRRSRWFIIEPGNPGTNHSTDLLALSPDHKVLAVGAFREAHAVGLISLESGKLLATVECGPPEMDCKFIRFAPDGRLLATDTSRISTNDQPVDPLLKFWKIPASW